MPTTPAGPAGRYRRIPVEVDAIEYDGGNLAAVLDWLAARFGPRAQISVPRRLSPLSSMVDIEIEYPGPDGGFMSLTLLPGDWVATDPQISVRVYRGMEFTHLFEPAA